MSSQWNAVDLLTSKAVAGDLIKWTPKREWPGDKVAATMPVKYGIVVEVIYQHIYPDSLSNALLTRYKILWQDGTTSKRIDRNIEVISASR